MTSPISNVLAAYRAASGQAVTAGLEPRETGGPSFSDMLQEAGKTAVAALKKSEKLTAEAAVGRADLNEVVNAVTNAEVTLQTVTAVRDKVISAYQEILRMPI